MENIFKNAFFGKVYKTKCGKKAIYHKEDKGYAHLLIIDDGAIACLNDGKSLYNDIYSVVSEWQEPITDKELNRLAAEYSSQQCYDVADYCCEFNKDDLFWAYKAGCEEIMKRFP